MTTDAVQGICRSVMSSFCGCGLEAISWCEGNSFDLSSFPVSLAQDDSADESSLSPFLIIDEANASWL